MESILFGAQKHRLMTPEESVFKDGVWRTEMIGRASWGCKGGSGEGCGDLINTRAADTAGT
jgi:hypothetical protein